MYIVFILFFTLMYCFSALAMNQRNEFDSQFNLRIVKVGQLFLAISLVVYFVGMRNMNTYYGDTWGYINTYNNLRGFLSARVDGELMYGNSEMFFWPFAYIVKFLGFNDRGWLIASSLLTSFLILISYRGIVGSKNYLFVLIGLYLSYYLVFSCAMRQSMAEAFVLLSFVSAIRKNVVQSMVFSFIAIGFHQSAIISLIFIILVNVRVNAKFLVFFMLASVSITSLFSDLLFGSLSSLGISSITTKVGIYNSGGYTGEYGNLLHHKQFIILTLFTMIYLYLSKLEGYLCNYLIYIYLLIVLFWSSPVMSGRMMNYLTLVFPLIVWFSISYIIPEKYKYITYSTFFSLLGYFVLSTESTQLVLGL